MRESAIYAHTQDSECDWQLYITRLRRRRDCQYIYTPDCSGEACKIMEIENRTAMIPAIVKTVTGESK